jgi:predicted nicotinamide N-methyase
MPELTKPRPSTDFLTRHAPLARVVLPPDVPALWAHQSESPFALWQAWEDESGQALSEAPFWGVVWPGARLLAQVLLGNPATVTGKRVLELGCGGAVALIAAAKAGAARATGIDLDAAALCVAEANARANDVAIDAVLADASAVPLAEHDVVLVADFFYHRATSAQVLARLRERAQAGALVLVANAERPFAPADRLALWAEADLAVNHDLEGVATRHTQVGQLLP